VSWRKVLIVAVRELVATVTARGFVIGVLVMPLLIAGVIAFIPRLIRMPSISGSIALIDRSGAVAPHLVPRMRDVMADLGPISRRRSSVADPTSLRVDVLPDGADVAVETARMVGAAPGPDARLAVAVIPDTSLADGAPFELYASSRLDIVLQSALAEHIAEAIVDARLERSGIDAARVRSLVKRPSSVTRTVTSAGTEETAELTRILMPFAFMMLLWAVTFTAGQLLLTTLVEEKSQRVMEVLLSAVSPLTLLTGKILGNVCVGLIVLTVYLGLGAGALSAVRLPHILSLGVALLLCAFFVIAFLFLAAIMAAVGSVVDDLRSAQSLLSPILVLMSTPLLLWLPIAREPSSTLAVVLSFVPPVGPFVTVLRLASPEPMPSWQIALSLVLGAASVVVAIWTSAKVFRVGVLLYGKPPPLRTMLSWLSR